MHGFGPTYVALFRYGQKLGFLTKNNASNSPKFGCRLQKCKKNGTSCSHSTLLNVLTHTYLKLKNYWNNLIILKFHAKQHQITNIKYHSWEIRLKKIILSWYNIMYICLYESITVDHTPFPHLFLYK